MLLSAVGFIQNIKACFGKIKTMSWKTLNALQSWGEEQSLLYVSLSLYATPFTSMIYFILEQLLVKLMKNSFFPSAACPINKAPDSHWHWPPSPLHLLYINVSLSHWCSYFAHCLQSNLAQSRSNFLQYGTNLESSPTWKSATHYFFIFFFSFYDVV